MTHADDSRHAECSQLAPGPKRVLVLCSGNSCRSQMAEGWIGKLLGERWEPHSAGIAPALAVNHLAVEVMAEVGVDLSKHWPKPVVDMTSQPWDLVITVCDSARETCPVFPGAGEQIHLDFPDPAAAAGSRQEVLATFRQVRDAIRTRLIPEVARRSP